MMKLQKRTIATVIIIGLIVLRFCLLETDPPLFFEGLGQAQLTDPYHLTFAARNAVLYGDWNPFDFHRWDAFKNSLISGLSYLIFSAYGVSRVTANLAAVFLSTCGILLFLLGLARYRTSKEVILAGLILTVNSTLFFYGRIPFLENGLIFLSGLTYFVFSRYHNRLWGCVVTGALVALVAFCGKLFGLLLIVPVMLALVYLYRVRAAKSIVAVLLGLVGGAMVYVALFYGTDITVLTNYYTEHTVGMYGPPPGLQSPLSFVEMLLKYGEGTLVRYNPFLILLGALSLIAVLLSTRLERTPRRELMPLVFCLGWFLTGVLSFAPLHHRPMRYSIFLILPVSAYVSYVICYFSRKKVNLSLGSKWLTLPIVFFAMWFVLAQVHVFLNAIGTRLYAGVEIVYYTAPLALILIGLLCHWLRKDKTIFFKRSIYMPLGILLLACLCQHGSFIYRGLAKPGQYFKMYNQELGQIMDAGATFTGPYTPAMTIDNEFKGVIYMFTLSVIEEDMFTLFPITHIATCESNWIRAVKDFPFLKASTRLVEMIVRERPIYIYRLPDNKAPPTDFERGRMYAAEQKHDSALVCLNRFCDMYSSNRFGRLYLALEQSRVGLVDDATRTLEELVEEYPGNYLIRTFCSDIYTNLFEATNDSMYVLLAEKHAEVARNLNWRVSEAHLELN